MMLQRAIRDPRLMILVLALIISGGVAGFSTRPSREDPHSQVRWGYVTTALPGAEPTDVEALVSVPIEQKLREAGTIRSIESSSLRGVSLVFIRLTDEVTDVDQSWAKIQDQLTEVAGQLPDRAGTPVLVDERYWGSHTRVLALHTRAETEVSAAVLGRWASELDDRLSFVHGTRFTETFGIPDQEIVVEVDEAMLADTHLTIAEISRRIAARNATGLDARSQSGGNILPVSSAGDIENLDQLREVVLAGDGQPNLLRLSDVASVRRGQRHPRSEAALVRGQPAAVIATRMDEAYDINRWIERQQQVLDRFARELPAELALVEIFNQKDYTDERAGNLYESLVLGMVLVSLVIGGIMGWRAAIAICAALPLTMAMVLFLMAPFQITLHQMSIAGLVLALGMLIDNPIIVVDAIQHELDSGRGTVDACRSSVARLTAPLLGSNVTTMLGFLPILLIGGPTGEFMAELGWSVIACLSCSLLLSLTVIPVLAGWCLRPSLLPSDHEPLYVVRRPSRRSRLMSVYLHVLQFLFRRRFPVILASLALPILGFVAAKDLEEQFFPLAERNHFHFSLRLPTTASLEQTERAADRARRIALGHPEVEAVSLFIGRSAPKLHYSMVALEDNRPNYAQALVQLRTARVAPGLVHELQAELDAQLPGAQCIVTILEQGPPAPAPIEFRIYGPSLTELSELGQRAQQLLRQVPGVIHTTSSLDTGGPLLQLDLPPAEMEAAGLSDELISRQLRDSLDGSVATQITESVEVLPVRVRLSSSQAIAPDRVLSLPLTTVSNNDVPVSLRSFANWRIEPQIFSVYRRNASRCNIISAYVHAGTLPIEIQQQFQARSAAADFAMPLGYRSDFGGISAERDTAVGNLLLYSSFVAVLMIAVLVLTFNSFRMAAIAVAVAMMAIGLGLASLWLFNYPIGIIAIIGIAGMMGLAINDSIVVLNECQRSRAETQPIARVVFRATRHILTTTITTVSGVLPLIVKGGVFWPPMMIVIAGGVVGATLLALGFTPACYSLLHREPTSRNR